MAKQFIHPDGCTGCGEYGAHDEACPRCGEPLVNVDIPLSYHPYGVFTHEDIAEVADGRIHVSCMEEGEEIA